MDATEGGRSFVVPDEDDPAFFNPAMELNRDITVAVLRAARGSYVPDDAPSYLDAMAAAGVRGVRAGIEGYRVTSCDRSEAALEYTRTNLDRHGIDAEVVRDDVRRILHASHFDVVDIDPFGSPMPYAGAAVCGTDRLLCVTATDTAPLCGAHKPAGIRRYASVPSITVDHPEIGLRTLIGALVRTAAVHDVAAEPILSHTTRHYHRTYLALKSGAQVADDALAQVGFLERCDACRWRYEATGLAPVLRDTCPACDGRLTRVGPLWLGRYRNAEFTAAVEGSIDGAMGQATKARRLLERLAGEADVVGHHDHHEVCDRLELPAGPMAEVLDGLRERGYVATRTHVGGTTFKTDAPAEAIEAVVTEGAASA